jgi:polysaccharide export outer membrane protein
MVQMVRFTMRELVALVLAIAVGAALTAVPAFAEGGRVLTRSDVVTIKVVSQPDMDTTSRVELDGTVQFPYVGRIKAAGLTEDGLARAIERRLAARQIVNDPHVLVEISNFGSEVSVQGQVGAPGLYTVDRPTTLTQILARAGGLRDTGATVVLQRSGPGGKTVRRYAGPDILSGKVNGDRIFVQNNDEIYVELAPFYYVYGYVGRTGEFPLLRPLTVQQAISIAGGLTPLGTDWRLKVKRKAADGQTMEMPASLDDEVQPNDTIIVNERLF